MRSRQFADSPTCKQSGERYNPGDYDPPATISATELAFPLLRTGPSRWHPRSTARRRGLPNGGRGRDTISGGSGNDVINARDGEVDTVSCGPGRDTVRADRRDRVRGCERRRR